MDDEASADADNRESGSEGDRSDGARRQACVWDRPFRLRPPRRGRAARRETDGWLHVARDSRDELLRLIVKRIGEAITPALGREELRKRTGIDLKGYDLCRLREGDPGETFGFMPLHLIAERLGIRLELHASLADVPVSLRTAPARDPRGGKSPYVARA